MNINHGISTSQKKQLVYLLQEHSEAFAWEYTNMKGIHPDMCTHHICIRDNSKPVRHPQRRMNLGLRVIIKEELHKLLNANFIYPISDSQWVSPLMIVPNKNEKWHICIDYRELNKATHKYHFLLSFIDQVSTH
jgi:hypothetical protein